MIREVPPELLQSVRGLLASNHSVSVILTEKNGRHGAVPAYGSDLSRLVFETMLPGNGKDRQPLALNGKPVLLDSPVPGIQYAAVSVPAAGHQVFTLLCGVLLEEESLPAVKQYIMAKQSDSAVWLGALSGEKIWTAEQIRRLLDGMERL
ncbi:hypothetical protein [Paenibacillus alkalitolerans]|uniref:hypothetical protein n=1 Tax=Paenibacillus alkalitolerans TaxID=2799335 RepID=UPI0018F296BE|nr:hypothetical protein [Paenibacillus alkalitolerans]